MRSKKWRLYTKKELDGFMPCDKCGYKDKKEMWISEDDDVLCLKCVEKGEAEALLAQEK